MEEFVIGFIIFIFLSIVLSTVAFVFFFHRIYKNRYKNPFHQSILNFFHLENYYFLIFVLAPVVVTNQSYVPPPNVTSQQTPQFPVNVQTSAQPPSAPQMSPAVESSTSMPLPFTPYQNSESTVNNTSLPYPPTIHQQTLPYPSENNQQFPMPSFPSTSNNNDEPPSYFKVKNNLV